MNDALNPYQSPDFDISDPCLPFDTEFLVSDQYVAGPSEISLPNVCIASGVRTGLLRKTRRTAWCPRWIAVPRLISVIIWPIFVLPNLLQMRGTGMAIRSAGIPPIVDIILIALTALPLCLIFIGWLLREPVTIHWSLSDQQHRRERISGRRALLLAAFTIAGLVFMFGVDSIVEILPAIVLISLSAGVRILRGPQRPRVLGKVDSLYLVGNLSPEFIAELHRMISRHSASRSPSGMRTADDDLAEQNS